MCVVEPEADPDFVEPEVFTIWGTRFRENNVADSKGSAGP